MISLTYHYGLNSVLERKERGKDETPLLYLPPVLVRKSNMIG